MVCTVMQVNSLYLSYSSTDKKAAAELSDILDANGFDCYTKTRVDDTTLNRSEAIQEAFDKSDAFVLILSSATSFDIDVRRDIEYAVNLKMPVFVLRIENIEPSGALKYYLSPFQWIDAYNHALSESSIVLIEILKNFTGKSITPDSVEARKGKISKVLWTVIFFLIVTAGIAIALLTVSNGSVDCLVIGTDSENRIRTFLEELGYTVKVEDDYPPADQLNNYDMIIPMLEVSEDLEIYFYDYLAGGGSLLLSGGQPYFLGMPEWLGMEQYSNFWGSGFSITLSVDCPLGIENLKCGNPVYHHSSFMDGGAVLMNPSTAEIDACFDGVDSLAACVRNTVGPGRVAWVSTMIIPGAASDGSGYTTEEFRLYLEALYAWLDSDGPQNTR